MEPPSKRLRLFGPAVSSQTNDYEQFDYDDPYDEGNFVLYGDEENFGEEEEMDEEEDEVGNDEVGEDIDPNLELQQKRARLDNKLKSKFEAIFEKYGRDFTGIGDEIDLKTGEIVVNNGHLLEMKDERDAGTSRLSLLSAFTQENDERPGSTEVEDFEPDGIDGSHITVEDVEEDDSILFGDPTTASKQPQTPPAHSVDRDSFFAYHQDDGLESARQRNVYPSESEILAQFGEQLGPQIASYVSQQRVLDNSSIEPAWQTPGLPLATPGRRPILKSILLQPETDRSPSPEGSSSVWAPKMPPGRRRKDGADVDAIFRGETIIRDRTWYSSGYVSTTVTKQRTERADLTKSGHRLSLPLKRSRKSGTSKLGYGHGIRSSSAALSRPYNAKNMSDFDEELFDEELHRTYRSQSHSGVCLGATVVERFGSGASTEFPEKRPRLRSKPTPFTEADDTAILQWVAEAQRRGYSLWSSTHWNMLAEQNPRHSSGSWCNRYRRCLYPKGLIPASELGDVGQSDNEEVEGSPAPSYSTKVPISASEMNPFYGVSYLKARQTLTPKKHRSTVLPLQRVEIIDLTRDDEPSQPQFQDRYHPVDIKSPSSLGAPSNVLRSSSEGQTLAAIAPRSLNPSFENATKIFNQPQVDAPKLEPSNSKHGCNAALRSPKRSNIAIKGSNPLEKLSRNPFDASYDFSDDEEEFVSIKSKHEQPNINPSPSMKLGGEDHQSGAKPKQQPIKGYVSASAKADGEADDVGGAPGQLLKSFQQSVSIERGDKKTGFSKESEAKKPSFHLDSPTKIADGEGDTRATPIQKRSVLNLDDSAEIGDSEDDASVKSDQELPITHQNASLIVDGDGVDADKGPEQKQPVVRLHSPIRVDNQEEDAGAAAEQPPVVEQQIVVGVVERGEGANATSKQEQSVTNSDKSTQATAGIAVPIANLEREQPVIELNPLIKADCDGEVTSAQPKVQEDLLQAPEAAVIPYLGGNRRPKWLEDALKAYQAAMSPIQPDWDPLSPVGLSKSSSPSRMSPAQVVHSDSNLRTPVTVASSLHKLTLSNIVPNDSEENPEDAADVKSPLSQRDSKLLGSKDRNDHSVTPVRRPILKRITPRNTSGLSSVKRRVGSSPNGSIIETPGGTVRRCGEKGYRCNKGFCFNCLGGEIE